MHIEEIVVDGFKSYAQRTVVPAFDPFFNAITGLNGSGKSNILDSICFVLGITNLSQVRAGSLQELVYKQGQAGVTKASVSIVFNNSDVERSPVGYEHCEQITVTRQIVIGGRNKYLINGHVAQPSRVQNLFHSVQLNVNNPHFLIMQGRITKVLNMKPPEILSMLEEAAGTRMYETKKENALKTLDKKQSKVDEINKLLEEDILPALEKLRKERGDYMRWTSANDKLERLRRFCVAYEFVKAAAAKEASAGGTEDLRQQLRDLAAEAKAIEADVAKQGAAAKRLGAEKEAQMGGDVKRLSEEVEVVSKSLVQETAAWTNKKEVMAAERDNERKQRAVAAELEASIAEQAAAAARLDGELAAARSALDSLVRGAEDAERTLAGVQSGKGTGDDKSLAEKLADARGCTSAAEADGKAARLRVAHLTKELAAAREALRAREKEGSAAQAQLSAQQAATEAARQAVAGLGFDPAALAATEARVIAARAAAGAAQERVDALNSQLAALDFQFRSPAEGFDRSRVKGKVARLLRVKEPAAATALEVLAGGKLFQLVVDTEQTGKALLKNGELKQRVTIIPLNKVQTSSASSEKQAAAATASNGAATLALSLVGYDTEVAAAMKYVFGGGFVCKDAATAKAVAFHRDIMMKCVTYDGDLFDPAGTLTGGSRPTGASVLAKLHMLAEAETQMQSRGAELKDAQASLASLASLAKQHAKLESELELKEHALALMRDRATASEVHQLAEAVARCDADLAAASAAVEAASRAGAAAAADALRLEQEIGAFATDRSNRLKVAEKAMKDARAALASSRSGAKAMEDRAKALQAERKATADELAGAHEALNAAAAVLAAATSEVTALEAKVVKRKAAYEACSGALEEAKQRARACDRELSALAAAKATLEKTLSDKALEAKKLEHKVTRLERDAREAEDRVARLQSAHPWIAAERPLFGRSGGDYDWAAREPEATARELAALEGDQEKLGKSVNKKVLAMFDKAEAEYKELTEKRRIVLNDKDKIEAVIYELDEKKKEALVATWQQVNRDFGSIFATLLPGTAAKLEPPEGGTCLDGLEVRVAFGSVWKQSLTELSGGQRSLLALSLILALLLFKPAPIYILDEVDAALDLSHTQNIGRMIRTHFPQSQFIVVSLKEGMFNNANVIFRTKFVDGVSTVLRTIPALKDVPPGGNQAQEAEAAKRRRVAGASKENCPA